MDSAKFGRKGRNNSRKREIVVDSGAAKFLWTSDRQFSHQGRDVNREYELPSERCQGTLWYPRQGGRERRHREEILKHADMSKIFSRMQDRSSRSHKTGATVGVGVKGFADRCSIWQKVLRTRQQGTEYEKKMKVGDEIKKKEKMWKERGERDGVQHEG